MNIKTRIEKIENILGADVRRENLTPEERLELSGARVMDIGASILGANPDISDEEFSVQFWKIVENLPIPTRMVTVSR